MTTIVAIHKPGFGTVIGSDQQISSQSQKGFLTGGKWVRHGDWAIGISGAFRTLNLARNHAEQLLNNLDSALEFTERLTEMLKSYGYTASMEESGPPMLGSGMLLASPIGVWSLDASMSVLDIAPNMLAAVGSGADYAAGSAHSTSHITDPVKRVTMAVSASIAMDIASGGQVWLDTMRVSTARRKEVRAAVTEAISSMDQKDREHIRTVLAGLA